MDMTDSVGPGKLVVQVCLYNCLFFPILLHSLHISRYLRRIFYTKICGLLRKSACLFRQVETKMYFPKKHFFKNSLAGASGLVRMSDPCL